MILLPAVGMTVIYIRGGSFGEHFWDQKGYIERIYPEGHSRHNDVRVYFDNPVDGYHDWSIPPEHLNHLPQTEQEAQVIARTLHALKLL